MARFSPMDEYGLVLEDLRVAQEESDRDDERAKQRIDTVAKPIIAPPRSVL